MPVDQAFTACPSTRYKLESKIVAPDLQDTGLQQTLKTIEKSMYFALLLLTANTISHVLYP